MSEAGTGATIVGPHAPARSLVTGLRDLLARHAPFAQMAPADVEALAAASSEAYFAPGERIAGPEDGPIRRLFWVRSGAVTALRSHRAEGASGFSATFRTAAAAAASGAVDLLDESGRELEAGDLLPIAAWLGRRAATATYAARDDVFCLVLPEAAIERAIAASTPFAAFLQARTLRLLELSRQAVQADYASRLLAGQSLESPLGVLARKTPVAVAAGTPLETALALMHERRVGSLLVLDGEGRAQGILTRHDVLGRVALPNRPLADPIDAVVSVPVVTLDIAATANDAAIAMSRHGVRHIPVTERGRVVGLVSERDLFAMQRLSLTEIGGALRGAADIDALRHAAADIRRFAAALLGQGVQSRQLTALISHLNDLLTERLVAIVACRHGADLDRVCWLAFGSEGRSEQTIATDQDNGLVFDSDDPDRDRPAWLAFSRDVNDSLDACGYPLCRGQIMASSPHCCLARDEWRDRFSHWIAHGSPADLLKACIFFDLRPLAGNSALAAPLTEVACGDAARTPRFIRQLADNVLARTPPLSWHGGLDTERSDGAERIDLKLRGSAIFVDAARLYALANGVRPTGTRQRFEAVAPRLGAPAHESEGWSGAFEFLQLLRLRVQIGSAAATDTPVAANAIDVATLNDVDRRVLKECFRIARTLQQRIALDWQR